MNLGIGRQNIIILFLEIRRLHSFISGNIYIYIGFLPALHLQYRYQYDLFSYLYTYVCCRVNILPFGNEWIDNCHVAL